MHEAVGTRSRKAGCEVGTLGRRIGDERDNYSDGRRCKFAIGVGRDDCQIVRTGAAVPQIDGVFALAERRNGGVRQQNLIVARDGVSQFAKIVAWVVEIIGKPHAPST